MPQPVGWTDTAWKDLDIPEKLLLIASQTDADTVAEGAASESDADEAENWLLLSMIEGMGPALAREPTRSEPTTFLQWSGISMILKSWSTIGTMRCLSGGLWIMGLETLVSYAIQCDPTQRYLYSGAQAPFDSDFRF
jgi:hypothetical protein